MKTTLISNGVFLFLNEVVMGKINYVKVVHIIIDLAFKTLS